MTTPDAALSHRSAGALWRILPRWHTPTPPLRTVVDHADVLTPKHLTRALTRPS